VEILKSSSSSDLFNPDVEKGGGTRRQDPVTKDLLAALLAVIIRSTYPRFFFF
jgi:hypothetical protein